MTVRVPSWLLSHEPFLLKDFFNRESLGIIADAVADAYISFDRDEFMTAVFDDEWPNRSLKQRMRHTAECLRRGLPDSFPMAIEILVQAAPAAGNAGFAAMVLSDFVEAFGVDDFDTSVNALAVFTRNISAEFAVRPLLIQYPERMLAKMADWATSDDAALRRLASEGTRPRLPWGVALKQYQEDPKPILPLLKSLAHDPSEDVRRSVANNLNDIAKDHPDLVIDLLAEWRDGSDEIAEITRHALRVLVKKGHRRALASLGYHANPDVVVADLAVKPASVRRGGRVTISFDVQSTSAAAQLITIDGVVNFARPKGSMEKVFKWKAGQIKPNETWSIQRSINLKNLSTRRIHPGTHLCDVQINGDRVGAIQFEVTE